MAVVVLPRSEFQSEPPTPDPRLLADGSTSLGSFALRWRAHGHRRLEALPALCDHGTDGRTAPRDDRGRPRGRP